MKKKPKYVKPKVEVIIVKLENHIAATSNATVSFGDDLNFYSPQYESWQEEEESKDTFEF